MSNLLDNFIEECETSTEEQFDFLGISCVTQLFLLRYYGEEELNSLKEQWDLGIFPDSLVEQHLTENSRRM